MCTLVSLVNRGAMSTSTARYLEREKITYALLEDRCRHCGQAAVVELLSGAFSDSAQLITAVTKIRDFFN